MQPQQLNWPYLAILIFLVVAITNTDAFIAPIKTAIVYTVGHTSHYSLDWSRNLINLTCFKHRQNGASIMTSTDSTTINLANLNSVDKAFAITRLARGAWTAVVAVCVVGVISNSFRVVIIAAVGVASLVTITALFFVTWNLGEILEYHIVSQNQLAAAN
jgi:hypothetical protein